MGRVEQMMQSRGLNVSGGLSAPANAASKARVQALHEEQAMKKETAQLERQKRQAQVDLDTDTLNRVNAQLKERRAAAGQQTVGDRVNDTLSSIFSGSGASYTNLLGTAAAAAGEVSDLWTGDPKNIARHRADETREILRTGRLMDGRAVTPGMIPQLEAALAEYEAAYKAAEPLKPYEERHPILAAAEKTLYGAADQMQDESAAYLEGAKKGLGAVGSTVVDAASGYGQSLLDAGIGALTGTGMAPFVARAFGGAAQEARRGGADLDQQLRYGTAQAAKEYITEMLFGLAVPQRIMGSAGSGSLDDAIEKGIRTVTERLAKTPGGQKVLGGILTWLAGGATEGLEEGIGSVLENTLINPHLRLWDPDTRTGQEKFEDALYDMLVGDVSGLMGVTNLMSYRPGAGAATAMENTAPQTARGTAQESAQGVSREGETQGGPAREETPLEGALGVKEAAPGTGTALKADTTLFDRGVLNDFNTARKKLIEFAKAHFPTQVVNAETGKAIGLSRKGLDKFLSGNITYDKYASGFHIPELIERAHKVGDANNYHQETVGSIPTFEYYDSPIQIDGKDYTAHIRVKNSLVGDKYYGHTISEIDDIKIEPPTRTSVPGNPAVQPENTGGSIEPQARNSSPENPVVRPVNAIGGSIEGTRPLKSDITIPQPSDSVKFTGAARERTPAEMAYDIQRVRQASSALGESGAKAMMAAYDGQSDAGTFYGGFSAYYQAGLSGADTARTDRRYGGTLTDAQKYAAYTAGQNDARASLARERRAAKYAQAAGTDSGLVYDDFVREAVESGRRREDVNNETRVYLDAGTAEKINRVAKDLGVRVRFVDAVRGGTANAQISGSEILVERNNENPVMAVIGHEMTHRMQRLAPEEYRQFRDLVTRDLDYMVQQRINDYARQGVELSIEDAMDEVAADYAGLLMDDGQVLEDFIRRSREDRTLLEKIRDVIHAIARKLTGREKKQALSAEQKLTEALGRTMDAARRAAARQAKSLQGQSGNDTMGAVRNSLKEDLENGRAREESREDFYTRWGEGSGSGFTVVKRGPYACAYRGVARVQKLAAGVRQSLQAWGINTAVVDGFVYVNKDGITTKRAVSEAATLDGMVFVNNETVIPPMDTAGHEAYHAWKGTEARAAYTDVIRNNLDYGSSAFREYQQKISDAYFGGEVDLSDTAQLRKFEEELFAYVSGHLNDGAYETELRPMFRDFDAVKAAWNELVALNSGKARYSVGAVRNPLKEGGENDRERAARTGAYAGSREGHGQTLDRERAGQDGRVRGELSAAAGRYGGVNPSFGAKPVRSWAEGHIVEPAKGSVAYAEQQTAVEYGVPSFVVSDGAWAKNKGGAPAFSAGGQVYFRETLPEEKRGMYAPHELTHVMRQVNYKPYLDFVERTPTMLNMSSYVTLQMLDHVAKHQHTTLENADPARLYDEFNATMYGHIASGTADMFTDGPGARAFHDFDAYAAELRELHERFKADHQKETKFSLKAGTVNKSYEALLRENELLRDRVDYWKNQTKRTKRVTTDKKAVEKAAKQLIKAYGADIDASEIYPGLQLLYDYISSGGDGKDELTYTEARRRANEIAETLVKNAVETAGGIHSDYSEVRQYLQTAQFVVSDEIRRSIPDYGDFRKRNFGRLNLVKGDMTNIDQLYEEMSENWPDLFDSQRESNPVDQLFHIAEVAEDLRGAQEWNPFSGYMSSAVTDVSNDILDRFFSLPQTKATFADRQALRLQESVARVRNQNRENAKKAIQREREVRDRQLQRLKDHYAQVRRDRAERRADSAARTRLLKIAKRLQNKKLPAVNRALLDQYIGDLDTTAKSMTGKTLERLTDLRDWYSEQRENDPDFISDPTVERDLERLSKRHISDLTSEEVADLTRVLLNIENELRTKSRLIDSKERKDIYRQGLQVIGDVERSGGSRDGLAGAFDKYIVTETLSPVRQIKRMAGYVKDDPLVTLVNELADGQRESIAYQMEAEKKFQKWTENRKFSDGFSGAGAKPITITGLASGKGMTTVEITPAMRAALYLHSLNDQNLRHIMEGGVTVPDMKLYRKGKLAEAYARGTTVKLTPGQVRSITADMTEAERAFARAAHDYFNGQSRDRINKVSEKLKGYSIAQVENYFPINTDSSFTKSDFETLKFDGTLEGMGFLKDRQTKAANPILLRDLNDVLEKSIDQHSRYVGLAIPVRNFNKVWGVTKNSFNDDGSRNSFESSVQKAVKNAWGESGYDYIEKLMTDLQSGSGGKNAWTKLLNRVRSNYAGAVLTLNASVAMKQAASYPTAAAVLGWKPLVRAMGDVGKVDLDLISRYTPLQWYRSKGFSTKELGDLRKSGGSAASAVNSLPPVLNWVQGADLITTRKLWKASEYYVRDHNRNLSVGTDAYYRAVAEAYNRVIEETQPNYTTMQRPQLLRSDDSLLGNLAMFKTQPFQNFNILYDAIGEYAAEKRRGGNTKAARETLSNAVTSQIAQLAVFAGMTMAWAMFRGKPEKYEDEDGEMTLLSVLKAIGKDMAGGALSGVPFGSDAWELLSSKLFGDRYYGMDAVTVTALTDTITSLNGMGELIGTTMKSAANGEDVNWNSARIKLDRYLDDISKAAGVPYENVVNLFNAFYRHACTATLGKYKGGYAAMKLTADPERDSRACYDLLFQAMEKNPEAYDEIYRDMVDSGNFEEDKIRSAMEKRMKEDQGVEHAEDLSRRYLSPEQERAYAEMKQQVSASAIWRKATEEQRKSAEEDLYNISVGNKAGETLAEKISGGAAYGVDDADYILYRLALHIVDQPTESGKLGSYTNEEVEAAIDMLPGLSGRARGYLWNAQGKNEKSNPYR